jgi:hypothetical protein
MMSRPPERRINISGVINEMTERNERAFAGQQSTGSAASERDENVTRVEEEGEADEPDAPTAEEENVGMSTVLDADPIFGVQDDAAEK